MGWRVPRAEELITAMDDGIVVVDLLEHRVRYWSASAERIFGWTATEANDKPIQALLGVSPLSVVDVAAVLTALRSRGSLTTTGERTRKDGSRLWVENRYSLVHDEGGAEIGILGVVRDVTAAKLAADERERARTEIEALSLEREVVLETAQVGLAKVVDRTIAWSNRGLETILGYGRGELVGRPTLDVYADAASHAALPEDARSRFASGGSHATDLELRRKDGSRVWVRAHGMPLHAEAPERAQIWAVADISVERAARDELARSEALIRSIFTTMEEAVVVYDATGGVIEANPAAERLLGVERNAIRGTSAVPSRWRVIHEDGRPCTLDERPARIALREEREVCGVVLGVERPDGELRWVSVSAIPLRARADEAPYAAVATMSDITDARRNEAQLRDREATLSHVLSGSNDGFFERDLTTGRVQRSARVGEMLGIDVDRVAPTFEGWLELVHPDDAPALREAMRRVEHGEASSMDFEFRARGGDRGDWTWLHARARRAETGRGPAIAGTVTDVTERRIAGARLDAELRINARLVDELRDALAHVTTLSGFLPICMHCHKIRDDKGFWERLEKYIGTRTGAQFSHGLCPECERRYHGDKD